MAAMDISHGGSSVSPRRLRSKAGARTGAAAVLSAGSAGLGVAQPGGRSLMLLSSDDDGEEVRTDSDDDDDGERNDMSMYSSTRSPVNRGAVSFLASSPTRYATSDDHIASGRAEVDRLSHGMAGLSTSGGQIGASVAEIAMEDGNEDIDAEYV